MGRTLSKHASLPVPAHTWVNARAAPPTVHAALWQLRLLTDEIERDCGVF